MKLKLEPFPVDKLKKHNKDAKPNKGILLNSKCRVKQQDVLLYFN